MRVRDRGGGGRLLIDSRWYSARARAAARSEGAQRALQAKPSTQNTEQQLRQHGRGGVKASRTHPLGLASPLPHWGSWAGRRRGAWAGDTIESSARRRVTPGLSPVISQGHQRVFLHQEVAGPGLSPPRSALRGGSGHGQQLDGVSHIPLLDLETKGEIMRRHPGLVD